MVAVSQLGLLAALERGAAVVTGNERAARTLRRAWDVAAHHRGERVWQPASILSWNSWTHALWHRLLLEGKANSLLLTPFQESRVWLSILLADPKIPVLSNAEELATLAGEAWSRLCAFRGQERFRRGASDFTGDPATFARWARSFEHRCVREDLLSPSSLESELASRVASRDLLVAAQEIFLVGLDRPTPAQEHLAWQWREAGGTITNVSPPEPGNGVVIAAADERDEVRGCARWLRDRLETDSAARLAVIVPDLDGDRDVLESVFREVLAPELEDITVDGAALPFEFSLGRPLDHEPLVQTALDLLDWATEPLPLEHVSRLLLSSFFAADALDLRARAEFDAMALRGELRLRPEVRIEDLRELLRRKGSPQEPLLRLAGTLTRMAAVPYRSDLRSRSFGDWTEWMRTWLSVSRWAELSSPLGSREFQVYERWETTLDALAALDFANDIVTLGEALRVLKRLARSTIFAPESHDAPVQVVGPREAAGSHFDAAWVFRAGELSWPPRSSLNPLLPWSLQRDLGMPGADLNRDHIAAEALTRRLAGNGRDVLFSYATSPAEGGRQEAAAVVQMLGFPRLGLADILPPEMPLPVVALERLYDTGALPALPTREHHGGVRVLELQAACGFRAFAEMRLGANDLASRSLGLNPGERGSAVHNALEHLWQQVGSQRELRTMSSEERSQQVARAVAQGLRRALKSKANSWDDAYLEAQQARLTRLLDAWLQVELGRPEFSVQAQEREQTLDVGPLRLSVRVDRVDVVDGQQVILDYKTGVANTTGWLGDRPDQPQVPLYALLATASPPQDESGAPLPLGALGLAEVRAGKGLKLRGFESFPGLLTTTRSKGRPAHMDTSTFEGQIARWQQVLEALAIAFAEGDVRVRPKNFPSTCERCGQRLLCRMDPALFEEQTADGPSEEVETADA